MSAGVKPSIPPRLGVTVVQMESAPTLRGILCPRARERVWVAKIHVKSRCADGVGYQTNTAIVRRYQVKRGVPRFPLGPDRSFLPTPDKYQMPAVIDDCA